MDTSPIPTNKLRFVEREVRDVLLEGTPSVWAMKRVRILQQWWGWLDHNANELRGEWRDVPLEVES